SRTWTKRRLLRRDVVPRTSCVTGVVKNRRTCSRSIGAVGLVSNVVPPSAFNAAIHAFTYTGAGPFNTKEKSSSDSYSPQKPAPAGDGEQSRRQQRPETTHGLL